MYFEKLTNKDFRIWRDNLANNFGILIVLNKDDKTVQILNNNTFKYTLDDYSLLDVKSSDFLNASVISIEYNKMMIERYGEEYQKQFMISIDKKINESKKDSLAPYVDYYKRIKKEINKFIEEEIESF